MDKLDMIYNDIQEIKDMLGKQNGRIRTLEVWRGYIVGIAVGVSAIISGVITWLKNL